MTIKLTEILAKSLIPDPTNPNFMPEARQKKLLENIATTGFNMPLLVRPHPSNPDEFVLIDGHHRLKALQQLGRKKVQCLVVDNLTDEQARILVASLNRLHGEDNPRMRAELIQELTEFCPLEELSKFLPEAQDELKDLLALLEHEEAKQAKNFEKLMNELDKGLPEIFSFVVPAEQVPLVTETLQQFQPEQSKDTAHGFVAMAKFAHDMYTQHHNQGGHTSA